MYFIFQIFDTFREMEMETICTSEPITARCEQFFTDTTDAW